MEDNLDYIYGSDFIDIHGETFDRDFDDVVQSSLIKDSKEYIMRQFDF